MYREGILSTVISKKAQVIAKKTTILQKKTTFEYDMVKFYPSNHYLDVIKDNIYL